MFKGWTKEAIVGAAVAFGGAASTSAYVIFQMGCVVTRVDRIDRSVERIEDKLFGRDDPQPTLAPTPELHVAGGR